MLALNIALDKIGSVITECFRCMIGRSVDAKPTRQTIARMADELGVLSNIQVASVMMEHNNLTLAWDGSPIAGDHINAAHVTMKHAGDFRSYVLQIDRLAGGMSI